MTDTEEKTVGGVEDGGEAEVAASVARVAWVKVGKIWWPGQVLSEDEMTDEMRREVTGKKSRKSKGNSDIYVVKFFNEDEYEVVGKPSDIILSPDDEKKFDLVKRAISQMKSTTLAENRPKFKQDVLHAERLLDPSSDLTTITKLLDGESLEPKKPTGASKYADIFPSMKPEKPSPVAAASTPGGKGKAGAVKFNFPSSRIINSASSKPASKIAPLPSDPSKKYHCNFCGYSSDRVNVITDHMKFCKAKSPATNSPLATSSANQNKKVTASAAATPSRKIEIPDIKPVASPVKKATARTPRVATPKTATTPMVKSPVKVAASSVATSSITATPTAVGGVKKRGRRSKKDKMLSDKQKAEILQDWNDSSSEGEDDSDDELDMPPSKPPELFLFGSERNKKRKAEGAAAPELDDVKVENGEGSKGGSVSAENGAGGKAVDEDQPPVLKKPRTDKELSDAFEALLRTTKPEHDKLLGKVTGEDGEEKMEVEEEEEEENNHLSDIEEDAMIVMKKVDVEDKEENKAENKKDEGEKEMEVVEEETEKEVEPAVSKKVVEEEKPVLREGRRSTRRSRALVAEEEEEKERAIALVANKAKEEAEKAKLEEEKIEKEKQEKRDEEEKKKKQDEEEKKKKIEKEEVKEEVEVSTPAVLTRGRRSRRASKPEESNKVVEEVVKETPATPAPSTPVVAKGRRSLRGAAAAAENKAVEEVKQTVEEVEVVKKKEEKKEEKEVKKEGPVVAAAAVAKPVATLTPTLASTRSRRGAKPVPPRPSVVEPVKEKEPVIEKPQQAVKSQVKSSPSKAEKEQEKVDQKVVEEPEKVNDKVADEPESVKVNQVAVEVTEPKITAPTVKTPKSSPAILEKKESSEPVPVPEPIVAEKEAEEMKKVADKEQLATPPPPPVVVAPPKASPKKAEVPQVTASKSKPSAPPPPTLAVAPSENAVVAPSKALVDSVPSPVKKAPSPAKESTPKSPAKSVVKPTPTEKSTLPTPVSPPKPVHSPQKTKVTTPATTAVPPASPQQVEQKSSPARPTPKPTGVTTGVEQKPQVATTPAPPAPVAAPSLPPPPPTVVAPPPPPVVVAPAPVSPPKAQPQKKPTAAVRPLVDTKEPPKEISSAPSTVKEVRKGNSTAAQSKSAAVPSSKEIPVSQQPPSVVQSSSQPAIQQQGQQQSPQTISVEGEVPGADGKQSPALVAQRVVHLVPVENADGTITYMLLSLENGSENPSVVLEQGAENAGTVLRLDKVEPMDTSQGGEGTSPHANLPMNPNEVEGIFLDKSVESANQIVSAIVSATGTATSTTSILENSTAYVTLAMDASALGASNSDTASVATSLSGQSTIVIPEGATMSTAAGGGQVVDGDPVTQQVFYMTEDGALVDPQSLGLTFEQLQVLLNQSS